MLRQLCHRLNLPQQLQQKPRSEQGRCLFLAFLQLLVLARERISTAMVCSDATRSLAVAAFYGVCSLSMNFLNKTVVSSYEFNFPYFIMACQMFVTVIFLDLLRLLFRPRPSSSSLPLLSPFTMKKGRALLPASAFFALHSTLSLTALHGMNIPMYGAVKRCSPIVSLALGVVVLKKAAPSRNVVLSILTITLGCLVAGFGDLQFDRHAYLMGSLSVLAQGSYLTLVQRSSSEEESRSTLEMVLVNGYNTLPFFLACSLMAGEPRGMLEAACLGDPGFHRAFAGVVLWGCALTFSQFLCASACSALTASLVGVAKAALQAAVGLVAFGGVQLNPLIVLGLILNFLGGFMYTHVKYREGQQAAMHSCSRSTKVRRKSTINPQEINLHTDFQDVEGEGETTAEMLMLESNMLSRHVNANKDHHHVAQVRMVNEISEENLTHKL